MKLSADQLAMHLNDRLRMLVRSANAYDAGDYAEATRLASIVVKLIGDRKTPTGSEKKNYISLATRLAIKPTLMADTSLQGAIDQPHLHGPVCILGHYLSAGVGMVPLLDGFLQHPDQKRRLTAFDTWWNAPVLRDCRGKTFSRRRIVETMRDQEDAHTDGELDPDYAAVAYQGYIGISQVDKTPQVFDLNPARVVVRQVAHEVLCTFVPDLPFVAINTKGLRIGPLVLTEVMQKLPDGTMVPVLDHEVFEFRAETTSSPEVWKTWESVGRSIDSASNGDTAGTSSAQGTPNDYMIRMAYLNYAPYAIEGVQAMVGFGRAAG